LSLFYSQTVRWRWSVSFWAFVFSLSFKWQCRSLHIQQHSGVDRCERNEQVLSQVMSTASRQSAKKLSHSCRKALPGIVKTQVTLRFHW